MDEDPIVAPEPDDPEGRSVPVVQPPVPDERAPDERAPDERRRRRRRRRWYTLGGAVGLLVAAIVGANLYPVPYYTLAPGSVRATEPLVGVEGAQAYSHDGSISFTTVSFQKASAWTAFWGWIDPATEVVETTQALQNQTPEDNRRHNVEMMDQSKQTAEVVALRKLGYSVAVEGTGAVVAEVVVGAAADGKLVPGDVIVAVDGTPVATSDALVTLIQSHKPGDTLSLRVEPGDPDPRTVVVALGPRRDDESKAFLGVSSGTRNVKFDLPFAVSIDSGEVGGPSAGLAFTLGIIDRLTPASLTGGHKVATTGTISLNGVVGPVGGVHQKAVAVSRSGADLFLVPPSEYDEAAKYADPSVRVVSVATLDDALAALSNYGGGTTVLAQASPGSTPGN